MKFTLVNKEPEAENCYTFMFEPEQPFEFKPGQFMRYHIDIEHPDERATNRFFSISSAPFEGTINLTTKFVPEHGSSFKKELQKLTVGQTIEATGQNGSFLLDDPSYKYVFIAGGIGITPFRSMLLQLSHEQKPINVTLLYANRDEQIIYKNELENLKENNPNFQIHYIIEPKLIDEPTIRSLVTDLETSFFYISGPEPMVQAMEKLLDHLHIERERVKRDYFPGYEII